MGQVSGSAARSWHRRRRDQRLGYSALGLGAGGFVLVLAGTLLVTEVVPNLLDEDPPAQRVEPASEISPLGTSQPDEPAAAPVRSITAIEGPVTVPAAGPGGQPQPPPEPEPPTDGSGGPDGPDSPGGPDGPGDPDPEPQPAEGPIGTTVDPVVETVADTAGGATGGATTPLTTPVVDLVDGVTDGVDGLLK